MIDAAYQDRLQIALMTAIAEASHDDTLGVPILKSGEIVAAMVVVMAGILTTSPETASPTKTRRLVDHIAKRLQTSIIGIKRAGGFPIPHVVIDAAAFDAAGVTETQH